MQHGGSSVYLDLHDVQDGGKDLAVHHYVRHIKHGKQASLSQLSAISSTTRTGHIVVACHHRWLYKVTRTIQALATGQDLSTLAHSILNALHTMLVRRVAVHWCLIAWLACRKFFTACSVCKGPQRMPASLGSPILT